MPDTLPPYDGPYSAEATAQAAELAARAIHYLALATRHPEALEDPADACRVLGSLGVLAGSLPQVCRQMADRLMSQGRDEKLRHDEGADPMFAAEQVEMRLDQAAGRARSLALRLAEAQSWAGHLAMKEDGDG